MTKKSKQMKLMSLVALLLVVICMYGFVEKIKEKDEKKESQKTQSITVHTSDTDKISAFSYLYEGTKYSFQKENDIWICENDKSVELDQDKVKQLISNLKEVTASRIVDENPTDLSEFGLLQPLNQIEVTDTQGNTLRYDIGNKNQTVNGYYLKTNDTNIVYLTGSFPTFFEKNLDDLKKVQENASDNSTTSQD